ncbi:porin [Vibrio sp. 10N.286.49.B3]|uniref:oligogalacturonate-specific porin KdgM family protein n=1 Tax=Vibrio sp. 10N.286.49.B3 TaxID=1880855 RepID=UPI000C829093|nr:oligogalacturonate-specific porin KdgM family protein [Vibrio sp. 10N.286.49.B3]PMH40333.1 porin [Vibrio sp. 10N.286.49.B3]
MQNNNKILLAVCSTLLATSVSAASLDFRQEYKHEDETYASRIKIGGSTGPHAYSIESKQVGQPFKDLARGDNEFEYSYRYKFTDQFYIQPGMPITFGNDRTTYKPQVRIGYNLDSGLQVKLRYRHEFRQGTNETGGDNTTKSKVTGNLDYSHNGWQFGFEANYEYSHDDYARKYDEDYSNWDALVKLGYKIPNSNWRPHIEFGNVTFTNNDKSSHERQLRSRVGITYYF